MVESPQIRLRDKLLHPSIPVTFFEMVPPPAGKPGGMQAVLAEVRRVRPLVDAINLPEIHDEPRAGERTYKFVPRMEPRTLGAGIRQECGTEIVLNRVVVHGPGQLGWLRETRDRFGVEHFILVGGESSKIRYAGPGVLEVAQQVREAGLDLTLGGITIPSRLHESERIRGKNAAGLTLFTTQVLFDSNDIVWLIQRLNGLEARVFLSFAPVSRPKDLEFLRWLGADIPADLDRFLLRGDQGGIEGCFRRSLDLAQRILMDVFDNLPPDPPPIGLNIEHINQRNFDSAVQMLEQLGDLYVRLVAVRARPSLA